MEEGESDTKVILKYEPDEFFRVAVQKTQKYLLDNVKLASTQWELLSHQSIQGRAINGWWAPGVNPSGEVHCYLNTSIEDVISALGLHVGEVKKKRQKIIDDIEEYIDRCFYSIENRKNGNKVQPNMHAMKPVNKEREPLGGIELFRGTLIHDPMHILVGAYIGGCIDSAEWREKVEQKYGIKMHKGVSKAVNMEIMKKKGYTLQQLASLGHENNENITLEQLIREGVVYDSKKEVHSPNYTNAYIELQAGYGISDDAAFLSVGLLYGIESAFGFLLMDAVDTWDKCTTKIVNGGQDEKIGQSIKPRYEKIFGKGSFPCSDDDIIKVIYLSAIDEDNYNKFPSCSQRRFVQINENSGLCPIENHILFIRALKEGGIFPPPMRIAFNQISSEKFYPAFRERYKQVIKEDPASHMKKPIYLPTKDI